MIQQLFLLLVIQLGLVAGALAESTRLTGEALRQAVSGRTVLIETPVGSFPIRYKGDGTMAGQAPLFVASLGTKEDTGRWWTAGDRLCQRWHRWLIPMIPSRLEVSFKYADGQTRLKAPTGFYIRVGELANAVCRCARHC